MGPYLEDHTEAKLKISFVDHEDVALDDLKRDLETASGMLGRDPERLTLPPKGFLAHNLTREQRAEINRILGPRYAKENRQDQQILKERISIRESGEPMVPVRDTLERANVAVSYTDSLFHEACGEYAQTRRIWYARQQVVEKLINATRAFNAIGIYPHLEDCFRPPEVQEGLLFRRIVSLAQTHGDWDWRTVRTVGGSLTAPVPGLAGHQAGAAIDLLLHDESGEQLDLGNEYAESGVISCINCPYVTADQYKTRMRFAHIMRMAGFRLLPTEDWHVSFGDRGMGIDGPSNDREAIYGPIKRFDRKTGKIIPYQPEKIDKPYLSNTEASKLITTSRQLDLQEDQYVITPLEAVKIFRQWLGRHRKRMERRRKG